MYRDTDHPKWKRTLWKWMYPTYAFFIFVLQVECLPNSELRKVVRFLQRREVEKSNYFLMRILDELPLEHYTPMVWSLRWNQRLDDTNVNRITSAIDPTLFVGELLDIELLTWVKKYKNESQ